MFSNDKWQHWKALLKHRGRPNLYTEARSNYLGGGQFLLFFDLDLPNLPHQSLFAGGQSVFQTKHGFQIIYWQPRTLAECFDCFQVLKQACKSDYYWSIPLWLRIAPKWDATGLQVSPEPKLIYGADYRKHLKFRKIYRTWD